MYIYVQKQLIAFASVEIIGHLITNNFIYYCSGPCSMFTILL